MNQAQNSTTEKSTDAREPPVNAPMEVTDLEPEPDVSGGMRCRDNLKQMGIG